MDELDYLMEGRPNAGFCDACLQEANNYSVHREIIGAGQRPSQAAEEAGDVAPSERLGGEPGGRRPPLHVGGSRGGGNFRLLFKDGE